MNRRKKALAAILAAGFAVALNAVPTKAEWKSDGNTWRWQEESGGYAQAGWKNINSRWYYFNEDGSMATGWMKSKDRWYYLSRPGQGVEGAMKSGWILDNQTWYYLTPGNEGVEGAMQTGWIRTGDTWYYADSSGAMQTGVVSVDGKVYCLAENGAMQTGQVVLDGKSYYFNESGAAEGAKPAVSKRFGEEIKDTAANRVQNQSQSVVYRNTEEEDDSDEEDTPAAVNPVIESVVLTSNGLRVILDKAQQLDISAFYVECPAGKDMTIIKAETVTGADRHRIYNLTTAVYQDNDYNLIITLRNGQKIQKAFTVNGGAPVLSDIVTTRVSDAMAEISCAVDDVGILYYLAVPDKVSRSAVSQNIPASGEEVKEKGEAVRIESGGRCEFEVEGLQKGRSYTLYLASAQNENMVPVMRETAQIEAQVKENGNSSITITEAEGVTDQQIRIVLSEPTKMPLDVSNFSVSCSKGESSLDRVETKDNQTYIIFLPSSGHMYSNTTYRVCITFPDGNQTEKSFYGDYQWPIILSFSVSRTAEDEIAVSIKSDEAGELYYLLGNEDGKPNTRQIKDTGSCRPLAAGVNEFTLPVSQGDTVLYVLPVDKKGNMPVYVASKPIPNKINKGNLKTGISCNSY